MSAVSFLSEAAAIAGPRCVAQQPRDRPLRQRAQHHRQNPSSSSSSKLRGSCPSSSCLFFPSPRPFESTVGSYYVCSSLKSRCSRRGPLRPPSTASHKINDADAISTGRLHGIRHGTAAAAGRGGFFFQAKGSRSAGCVVACQPPEKTDTYTFSNDVSTSSSSSEGPASNGHGGLGNDEESAEGRNGGPSFGNGNGRSAGEKDKDGGGSTTKGGGSSGAGGGMATTPGKDVESLSAILEEARAELPFVRAQREVLEEKAQEVAQKAVLLREEASEAEKNVDAAMAKVEVVLGEEAAATDAVKVAEAAVTEAEDAVARAEAELASAREAAAAELAARRALEATAAAAAADVSPAEAAKGKAASDDLAAGSEAEKGDGSGHLDGGAGAVEPAGDSDGDEAGMVDTIAVLEMTLKGAVDELHLLKKGLEECRGDLERIVLLRNELQAEAAGISVLAQGARERALAGEEAAAIAMAEAETAAALEVENIAKVNDAEILLQKAEKLEAEAAAAAAAAAVAALSAAVKAEKVAIDAAAQAAAAVKATEVASPESPQVLEDRKSAKKAAETVLKSEAELRPAGVAENGVTSSSSPSVAFLEAEEAEKDAEAADERLKADKAAAVAAAAEAAAAAAAAAKEEAAAAKEREAASGGTTAKSTTKKSSRFFSASPFSTADDGVEFSFSGFVPAVLGAIKQHLPTVVLTGALVIAGGLALNHRMERRLLLEPVDVTTIQTPNVKPLVAEIKKIPPKIRKAIDKLPHHEPNEEETQLYDVLWLLLASVVFVPLFQRLPGGSPVLGYLVGGALIGPNALSIIQNVHGTKAIAEFGVVFLMFNIGLELSLERLRSMRKYVFGLGSAQVLGTAFVVGIAACVLAGVTVPAGIVIGSGLALSSTAVVLQVLQERGESTSRHGRATFSVLLFQDLAVVVILILIPLLSPNTARGGVGLQAIAEALGLAAIKAVFAIGAIIAGGRLLLRPVYKSMAEMHNAEIFAANTLLVVLGTSVLTARAGLSMALGAFLAGLLLAETEFALQVESDINAYRGLLLGLFFMTVGMSIDPKLLVAKFPLIMGSMSLLIVGKTLLVGLAGHVFGLSAVPALRAGLLLAPGGEFAFVAFGEGVKEGIMSMEMSQLLFLIVGLSMAVTPWLAAGGQALASRFEQQDVRSLQPDESEVDDLQGHIIVAGFGRVGQVICQFLAERLIPFVALDVRSERVATGRALDLPVYFGDAGSQGVLHKVGAERAAAAVIALDTPGANYRVVWALSKHFPNVKTFVRAHDVDHGINLEKAGATAVVPETLEPSLQLAAAVLLQVKVPAAEIAAAVDDFRSRHLEELTELASASGTSLGYGFSRLQVVENK